MPPFFMCFIENLIINMIINDNILLYILVKMLID